MPIEIQQVFSRKDLRAFIHLPKKIHQGHKNWLPPIYIDEWKYFNPAKNREFLFSDTILLLAYKNGQPMGRIMGIINKKYNEYKGIKQARFGYLECYNDPLVSNALISSIEHWALESGMEHIIGPYGFSDKDPQGLLIEGFEHMPIPVSPCNFPYLVDLVLKEGYKKEIDCFVYQYNLKHDLPELYNRIMARALNNGHLKLHEFETKKQLKPLILPALSMMNNAYSDIYGFAPLDDKEMREFADRYMPILNPHFVKMISFDNEIAGFLVGLPNLSKGIQRSGGRLFPFGLFNIIKDAKKTKQLDLMLVAVKDKFRGRGLDVMMATKLVESAKKLKFEMVEIHLMLETNFKVLGEMKKAGAVVHKKFRVFRKELK